MEKDVNAENVGVLLGRCCLIESYREGVKNYYHVDLRKNLG